MCVENKPVLLLGYGNPSRGDDALGPVLLEMIEKDREQGRVPDSFDAITDFQLQIEHALDMQYRRLVLFVDASVSASAPFDYSPLKPLRDNSYSSHAMSPAALLAVYAQVCKTPLPAAFLLAIPGYHFELGTTMTAQASEHLEQARDFVRGLLLHRQYTLSTDSL